MKASVEEQREPRAQVAAVQVALTFFPSHLMHLMANQDFFLKRHLDQSIAVM